jgi:histidinol-phosphate/aromatic aminotransferase/cobyric acid decarboxylase-like protein
MYHGASWKTYFPNWCYLNDQDLDANDAVIISVPFSDTGNIHTDTQRTLDRCSELGVPVLIDCAFVGICANIEFNFDQPCITDIVFSLSKTFPVANLRVGMRLTRVDDDDSLLIHKKTNYTNRLGAAVGLDLLEQYDVDYNYQTWADQQLAFCKQLNVVPSNSVIFGLGDQQYQQYNRGNQTNRLSLARYLKLGQLPHD